MTDADNDRLLSYSCLLEKIAQKADETLASIVFLNNQLGALQFKYTTLYNSSKRELQEGGYTQRTCERGVELLAEIHPIAVRIARLWDVHHTLVGMLVAPGVNEGDKPPFP